MKRLFAIILAAAMICALLCACGGNSGSANGKVTTTVNSKYDDGYANKYASSSSVNSDGNTVYEFTDSQYKSYQENHKNTVSSDIQSELVAKHGKNYGQYVFIDEDAKSVMVGLNEGDYDEATAADEAKIAADYGFKYFQSLQNPVKSIKVVFCNAGDRSKVYGSFDFSAE